MNNSTTSPAANGSYLDHARQVLTIEIEALAATRDALGAHFEAAIELMLATIARPAKIVVTGVGKNLAIAEKISATLASTGSTSVVLNPVQAMHGDLGILAVGDLLLALSFSGESEEILALIPAVRRLGIPVVAMTGNMTSSLAGCSRHVLHLPVSREACPFNMAPTASTTATLALGDAIAMVLLTARGFRRDDYALLHPAGAIGRTLLLRVTDIMRSGSALATVPIDSLVQDAVVAMTRAQSGSASIVTPDGRLAGIFTDGDLRRYLTEGCELLTRPIAELMTQNPIRVTQDQLAVDVLHVFERHKIDDLPVVDSAGRLVGCIDIQDLPRLKIL